MSSPVVPPSAPPAASAASPSPVSPPPTGAAPPPAPSLKLPAGFSGDWRRDWRLRGELVGSGEALLTAEGLWLKGRRTTPTRSALHLGLRIAFWLGLLAASGLVLLSSSGLAFRTEKWGWILIGPALGLPLAWLALWIPAALLRRWLQPRVAIKVPWSEVERLASEGTFLELVARLPSGPVWGRLRPRWWGRAAAEARLRGLRDGGLPVAMSAVSARRPRSAWLDRIALLSLAGLLGWGGMEARARWLSERAAPAPVAAEAEAPAPSALYARAAERTRAALSGARGGTAAERVDAISGAAREVWAQLREEARRPDARAEVDEGILAAIDWAGLLDRLSMRDSLARVELLRQRLDGADPAGTLGHRALFALASAYLERLPADPTLWRARVQVAEAWLGVRQGREWSLDGRAVRVPDAETAENYQAIGRFLLADLATDVERALADGEAPLLETLAVGLLLERHGLHLNLQPSSSTKALIAWGTGDFEYVLNRAWLKAQQAVRDEEAAVAAAREAGYRLGGGWSARDGAARYATVERDGRTIGWLALFDASKVEISWGFADGARAGGPGTLLLTSGAYVTGDGRSAGLAVERGRVDNWLLDRTLGGMVVLDRGARVLALREGVQPAGSRRLLRPLERLADLYTLLDGLRRAGASAFQTHVLAAGGELAISGDRASPELRERRLLITARYGRSPILAVLDIPGASRMSLYEAAVVGLVTLETPESAGGPGLEVDGIANLDVGSYDILGAWTDQGELARQGPVSLAQAKNLLQIRRAR